MLIFANGVRVERATVSVLDHGFLFGDSVYEVMRSYASRLFAVVEHLERLEHSARQIGLPIPWQRSELLDELQHVCEAWVAEHPGQDTRLRLIITRGEGSFSLSTEGCDHPQRFVIAAGLPAFDQTVLQRGLKLKIVKRIRNPHEAISPNIKSGNYLNNVLGFMEAQRSGADDAIFLNHRGHLAEGSTCNLFFVHRGLLKTPALSCGILSGITRSQVLQLCEQHGLEYAEGNYRREDLLSAEEAFVTGTTKGVLPVGQVDELTLPHVFGPVTQNLYRLFNESVREQLGLAGPPEAADSPQPD